jgi:hypothetical protein
MYKELVYHFREAESTGHMKRRGSLVLIDYWMNGIVALQDAAGNVFVSLN